MTSITRRYRFPASHRLHVAAFSDAENAVLFGKCNNPFGHGHNYVLEVTAQGGVGASSGLIIPVEKLDRLIEEQILQVFSSRNINTDVPEFSERVATTENIASVITDLLQTHWAEYIAPNRARLARIRVEETDRNSFEIVLPSNKTKTQQHEEIPVHAQR